MHAAPETTVPARAESPLDAVDAGVASRSIDVALGRGASYADVFVERRESVSLVLEDGRVRVATHDVAQGAGVRARVGDATGHAYTESISSEALRRAADVASRIAPGGRVCSSGLVSVARLAGAAPIALRGAERVALLRRIDEIARATDPRVSRVEVTWAEERADVRIATSDGVWVRDVRPLVRLGVSVLAEADGRRREGRAGGGGRLSTERYLARCDADGHAREAVREAIAMLDARPAPAGVMDVVIAPGVGGVMLHEAVGHGLEADFHRRGTSLYGGRVGEPVASACCTVVDDGTLDGERGSLGIDDEGVRPRATVLIERGVLRGLLHDRHSAAHFGAPPTGHGRRESFRVTPMPRMTNTMLLGGEDDPEAIVRSVARGLYVRKIRGGEVDIGNGDFVFMASEAYRIEDGRITAPVTGAQLIGNGPDVMRRVTMLGADFEMGAGTGTCGKDGQSVPVGVGSPTMKIAGMTVGGTRTG